MTWRIEPFDPAKAPEEDIRAEYDLSVALQPELWPEDPIEPYDQWKKDLLEVPSWNKRLRWQAWNEDRTELLGGSVLHLGFTETNRNLAHANVWTAASTRRKGLATALLQPLVQTAKEDGRTILGGGAPTDTPGTAFAEALGAERKIVERKSRMTLANVDRAMLEEWVAKAKERAEGYSLLRWDGPVPEEYLQKFVDLTMVMNTAPRDDLEMDDWVHTPERHREQEQRMSGQGYTWWTLVARHDETDELVGYTEFFFSPVHAELAWQEATAVNPTHRDKGLGRWLKAANCLRLMDERPNVDYVDTWNAFSNGPMLGINIAMGFEIVKSFSDYQITTDNLEKALTDRSN